MKSIILISLLSFVDASLFSGNFFGSGALFGGDHGGGDTCGSIVAAPTIEPTLAPMMAIRKADCYSFLVTITTPRTVTTTSTITFTAPLAKRDLAALETTLYSQPFASTTSSTMKSMPPYASNACTSTASYSSACKSAYTFPALTLTAPTPTRTVITTTIFDPSLPSKTASTATLRGRSSDTISRSSTTSQIARSTGTRYTASRSTGVVITAEVESSAEIAITLTSAPEPTEAPFACNADNCLRAFIREGGQQALDFCGAFTASTVTSTNILPSYATQCRGSTISRVSSACTCLKQTLSPASKTTEVIRSSETEASIAQPTSDVFPSIPIPSIPIPPLPSLTLPPFDNSTSTSLSGASSTIEPSANVTTEGNATSTTALPLSSVQLPPLPPFPTFNHTTTAFVGSTGGPSASASFFSSRVNLASSSASNWTSQTTSTTIATTTTITTTTITTTSSTIPTSTSSHLPVSPAIQTCSDPLPCSILSVCDRDSTCLCQPSITTGDGYCLGSLQCEDLDTCERDSDCDSGSACMLTCCLEPKCLTLGFFCPNPISTRQLFKRQFIEPVLKVSGAWSGVTP